MIDTIKVAYPFDPDLIAIIESNMSRLVKLSPSGLVEWSKSWCQFELASHYDGLRISLMDGKGLESQGFKGAKSAVMFEFSLQKWQSETGYNNENTSIEEDLEAFDRWANQLSGLLSLVLLAFLWVHLKLSTEEQYRNPIVLKVPESSCC